MRECRCRLPRYDARIPMLILGIANCRGLVCFDICALLACDTPVDRRAIHQLKKDQIVKALKEMADLLEIVEASRFEVLAYRRAAVALDDWPDEIDDNITSDTLTDIPTIGAGTAKVIKDLSVEGISPELQGVRSQVPDGLPLLLRFRGLGPKKVRLLWKELDIESTDDLERAIKDGSVAKLKGFGAKSIESLQASIEYFNDENNTKAQGGLQQDVPKAPASSGRILAGTSGYSYPAWRGSFYPPKAKTAELLQHYANLLPSVEINNTFYRFPSDSVVNQWKAHTAEDFQFSLKAHRRITHQLRLNESTRQSVVDFTHRCSALGRRLGCILYQLPPDFGRDDSRLNNLLSALPHGPRYAIEFRHKSWHNEEVFEQLKSANVACVSGNSATSNSVKFVTADFVYVRLRKPVYSDEELASWNDWFDELRADDLDVLVYLKHDETGDAPIAVRDLWYN